MGNELQQSRAEAARQLLPSTVRIEQGDAFSSLDYRILCEETDFDEEAFELLRSGAFVPDEQFLKSSPELLSITASWIVGQAAPRI